MAKASTPTFVTTIPLKTDSYTQAVLKKRFFPAQQQYNALLGEALKRLRLMRADNCYKEARATYKQEGQNKQPGHFLRSCQRSIASENTIFACLYQAVEQKRCFFINRR